MPRLQGNTETELINGMQGFQFSGIRTEELGATEYTLVTIAVDVTGSVIGFEKELRDTVITAVEACQKSPRKDNLLLRVITFAEKWDTQNGINELHGFKALLDIDPQNDYPDLDVGGSTPLYKATFSVVGATAQYAEKLTDDDYLVNAINFIITDGGDNEGGVTPAMIAREAKAAIKQEKLESMINILIGVDAQYAQAELDQFKDDAQLDQYIDMGDVTKQKLAKLARFVSQSISSQSQALGTGGPSQNISATI